MHGLGKCQYGAASCPGMEPISEAVGLARDQLLAWLAHDAGAGKNYQGSEADVKHAVINPLLEAAGWRFSPDCIKSEFPVGGKGWVDYALMAESDPVCFVEAKRITQRINPKELAQALSYAQNHGVRWSILTNGRFWLLLDGQRKAKYAEEAIAYGADLLDDGPQLKQLLGALSPTHWSHQKLAALVEPGNSPYPDVPLMARGELEGLGQENIWICPMQRDGLGFLLRHSAWSWLDKPPREIPTWVAFYIGKEASKEPGLDEEHGIVYVARVADGTAQRLVTASRWVQGRDVSTYDKQGYDDDKLVLQFEDGQVYKLKDPILYRGKHVQSQRWASGKSFLAAHHIEDLQTAA